MKILHRYILSTLIRNFLFSLLTFTLLFWVFDFFDRIDNILPEDAPVLLIAQYFLYKIPITVSLMLPVAMLVSCLFTIGLLSRNSEITAMRASGAPVLWLARPIFGFGLLISVVSILLNETIVPYSQRRVREIYNIDIRQKTKTGTYSQNDFWWRSGNQFYTVNMFDSRDNTLIDLSQFELNEKFRVSRRQDTHEARWIDSTLGWTMQGVTEYRFDNPFSPSVKKFRGLPLPIHERPRDFYSVKTDPDTMTYRELKEFIDKQAANGISVAQYLPDLFEKFAFPFINFITTLVVLPFALQPARSGSMAKSFLAGLSIGFVYYAVHSFSIALGRAELWPPLLSAWMANIIMLVVGLILSLGTEAPA